MKTDKTKKTMSLTKRLKIEAIIYNDEVIDPLKHSGIELVAHLNDLLLKGKILKKELNYSFSSRLDVVDDGTIVRYLRYIKNGERQIPSQFSARIDLLSKKINDPLLKKLKDRYNELFVNLHNLNKEIGCIDQVLFELVASSYSDSSLYARTKEDQINSYVRLTNDIQLLTPLACMALSAYQLYLINHIADEELSIDAFYLNYFHELFEKKKFSCFKELTIHPSFLKDGGKIALKQETLEELGREIHSNYNLTRAMTHILKLKVDDAQLYRWFIHIKFGVVHLSSSTYLDFKILN